MSDPPQKNNFCGKSGLRVAGWHGMETTRRAVIDIGTNSVKLLVADVVGDRLQAVLEQSHQTRLGAGFYETRHLAVDRMEATAETVDSFAREALEKGASGVCVIATSAAREAINQQELVSAVQRRSGLGLRVLSGEQEADLAFQGVTTDPRYATVPILLQETGGGSTQLIFGAGNEIAFRGSFPLGTVRLLEAIPYSDPPTPAERRHCSEYVEGFLGREVVPAIGTILEQAGRSVNGPTLVGAGGTASILAAMETHVGKFDREAIESARLTLDRLRWHESNLWSCTAAQRKRIVGLPPKRADVILMGCCVYRAVAQLFGFTELRVSTRGLRFAALLEANWR